jgi:hypothetical protein
MFVYFPPDSQRFVRVQWQGDACYQLCTIFSLKEPISAQEIAREVLEREKVWHGGGCKDRCHGYKGSRILTKT